MRSKGLLVAVCSIGIWLPGCMAQKYQIKVDVPAADVGGPIETLVVNDFSSKDRSVGAAVAQTIRNGIAAEGYIKIVDHSGQMTLSGSADGGKVRSDVENASFEVTEKVNGSKQKKTVPLFKVRKRSTVSLSYTLRQGSHTVTGNTFKTEFDQTWSGDTADQAKMAAKDDDDIATEALATLAGKVVGAVSAHKEIVELELEGGSHPGLKQGIVYMQAGRLDQALDLWKQVIEQAETPKDRAAAYYDIGVIKEAQVKYADAFANFRNADMLVPANPKYIAALSRVEAEQKKRETLAAQTAGPKKSGNAK